MYQNKLINFLSVCKLGTDALTLHNLPVKDTIPPLKTKPKHCFNGNLIFKIKKMLHRMLPMDENKINKIQGGIIIFGRQSTLRFLLNLDHSQY